MADNIKEKAEKAEKPVKAAAPKAEKAEKPVKAAAPKAEKAEKPVKAAAPKAEKVEEVKAEKPAKAQPAKQIKVTLVKSTISSLIKHKRTVEALGLKKIRSFKIHNDNEAIRGMIFAVKHLVKVEEV